MFVSQHFTPRWKKEWIPLATQQLRLRNLIQILAFSIRNDKKKTVGSKVRDSGENDPVISESYYFTLHATTMSAPFYTSEKLTSDSPKWKELEMSSWDGNVCSSVDAVVIRLWFNNPQEPDDKVLAVWGVYLSGLTYLGPNLRTDIPLKPNSIVLLMPGGYFTDPKCVESDMKIRFTSVIVNNCDVRQSYTVKSLARLQDLQQVIKKETSEAELLKKKISVGDFFRNESRGRTTLRKLLNKHKPKTNHSDLMKVKENIEIAKFRVQVLKEEKIFLSKRLKELHSQIESLSTYKQIIESKMMENYRILKKDVQSHREWKKSYIDKREKYLHSKAMLSFRTKQLISELNLIYPIVEVSQDKYTICGVHLPNSEDFAGHDDLQISIALGFVTHVIQMISIFMQIPLRYPVIHFGSRSKIIDEITDKIPDSEREFCLYVRGKEKFQFHYAVFLLNKNIAQMRWLWGLPTSDLRNTLENLSSLVKMKLGNSNLDQNSRSLSSSTVDIRSSTVSASSPLGSVMSFHAKKNSRMCNLMESVTDMCGENSNLFSPREPVGRISKPVGSKDLMMNLLSVKHKNFRSENKKVSNNLSFSLDKGLNEYEEIANAKEGSEQFGSEPTLNSSATIPKTAQSDAKNRFLKTWNDESQKVPFSDDDSDIHIIDENHKKQNTLPPLNFEFKEEIKDCDSSVEERKSNCSFPTEIFSDSLQNDIHLTEVSQTPAKTASTLKEEAFTLEKEQMPSDNQDETVTSDKSCDVTNTLPVTDSLLQSVTSRTEALANQTTCFNRFKTRYKNTLESSN